MIATTLSTFLSHHTIAIQITLVIINVTTNQIYLISMVEKEKDQAKPYPAHHIVPTSGKWAIKRDGLAEAIEVFSTKGDAVKFAREISRKQGVEIVIHGRDGRIMSTNIYGQIAHETRTESGFGCARGLIIISPDFDEPLEEFGEYI